MPLSRESQQIESILAELGSDSAGRKTAAFDSIVLFFMDASAWNAVNKKTRNRLVTRVLEFLDSPPLGDSPETVTVSGVPLELVGLAGARMQNPLIRARIDRLRRSGDANVRECIARAWQKAWPESDGLHDPGVLFGKQADVPSIGTKGEGSSVGEEESGMAGLGAEFGGPEPVWKNRSSGRKSFWKSRSAGGEHGLAPAPPPPAHRIPKIAVAKSMDMDEPTAGPEPPPVFTRARPPDHAGPAPPSMDLETEPAVRRGPTAAMEGFADQPERHVNQGFVAEKEPDTPIFQTVPLQAGAKYYFIVSIGKQADWSGLKEEGSAFTPVPEGTPLRVDLDVAKGNLSIPAGADIGELRIAGDHAAVELQPGKAINDVPASGHADQWLFFPVRTPPADDDSEMVCTILYKQAILQRHRITVKVREKPGDFPSGRTAWESKREYSIAETIVPDLFAQIQEHRASLFFNLSTQGESHVSVFGTDGQGNPWKKKIVFQALELQNMIDNARTLLAGISFYRDAAGHAVSFYPQGKKDLNLLKKDLLSLAGWGSNIHGKLLTDIRVDDPAAFSRILDAPSFIQIAMQENPQNFFPAALIYDFPLNTLEKPESYTLCPQFCSYLEKGTDLGTITCYGPGCQAKNDPRRQTICPLGFWGFRHNINMPLSVEGDTIPAKIPAGSGLKIVMVTADELDLKNEHRTAIGSLVKNSQGRFPNAVLEYARSEQELLSRMKESPQILYFFCHGGDIAGDTPVLKAGPENGMFLIDPKTLREVTWQSPRPLVFINGCHTGDVEPKKYLDFIEPLIVSQRAAGVIGTEITIFADMASVFAEKCLASFLAGGTIAESIRGARLKVLSAYNPLGLVFNPFIAGGIRLG